MSMSRGFFGWILLALVLGIGAKVAHASMRVEGLRCEYGADPMGIDVPQPRLSWRLISDERGQRQSAYRILVASSEANLRQDRGDLWDSGKVSSQEQSHIAYAGRALQSRQRCFWKVRAWDKDGQGSAWSAVGTWAMGLLNEEDWQAKWIGAASGETLPIHDCAWVWHGEPTGEAAYGPGTCCFRKRINLPQDRRVEQAEFFITADNSFTLFINDKRVGDAEVWERLRKFDVTGMLRAGENVLAVIATNGGSSANPAGVIGKLVVRLEDGHVLSIPIDGSWKSSGEAQDGWEGSGFDDSSWATAQELGRFGMEPWRQMVTMPVPLPVLRREFELSKPVRRAEVYVCGLGQFELRLNGAKVGDAVMEPVWTNYRKTCLYVSHDVTAMVRQGRNALGVMLGNGMYNVEGGRYVKFYGTMGKPKVILQMHVEYADGTSAVMGTDESWKTAAGPVVFSCIYGGEDYDARREQAGWDRPGFDDSGWKPVRIIAPAGERLASQRMPAIKMMREYPAVKATEPRPGVRVYDLGQNFSGWPRLTVKGNAGAMVKMTPGELLDGSGLVTQRSSGGPMWFSYTLKGDGEEVWHPRFSYYGFRYLQVEVSGEAQVADVRGQFIHCSAAVAGRFECSNLLINQIHQLINAAVKSNFQSVLTDCPHREKLGWLEVAHLMGRGIMYNFEAPTFYAKVADDMREAQTAEGLVPDIAPEYTVFVAGFRDSPEWGSACVIVPWLVYQTYGDRSLLEKQYEVMKRYVMYLKSKASDHIVTHGLGDWYDIGPAAPGESQLTSKGLTATAIYYYDLEILRQASELLGRADDARAFAELAGQVRAAFNKRFFHPETHQYDRNSQTASAMPLVLGLVDEEKRPAVLQALVNDVRGRGNRVTAGDVGFMFLVQALSEGGYGDVLYDMVCQEEGPGYACQLRKGATTLTEAWDANPNSSHNHCMLGHAEEWFYSGLAGIRPDPAGVGFAKIVIKPQMVGNLTWVKAHYDSVRERIISEWEKQDGRVRMHVVIPPNATARVYVPAKTAEQVKESGKPASEAAGVRFIRMEENSAVYEVGSGTYRFES